MSETKCRVCGSSDWLKYEDGEMRHAAEDGAVTEVECLAREIRKVLERLVRLYAGKTEAMTLILARARFLLEIERTET